MRTFFWIGMVGVLAGCPGDDSTAGTDGDTDTDTSMTSMTSMNPTGGTSTTMGTASMSGGSSSATTMTTADTEDATTIDTVDPTTGDTGDPETSSGSTGTADVCADLGRDECAGNVACTPIVCSPYTMVDVGGAMFCLGAEEFIGCRSADLNCARVRTSTCEGDDATVYLCGNACIPDSWIECAAPAENAPPCPGDDPGNGG